MKNTLVSNGCYEDAATSWEDRQEVLRDLSKKQAANVIYLLASLGSFFKQWYNEGKKKEKFVLEITQNNEGYSIDFHNKQDSLQWFCEIFFNETWRAWRYVRDDSYLIYARQWRTGVCTHPKQSPNPQMHSRK